MPVFPAEDAELERRFQSMPLFCDAIPADGEPMSTQMEALKALLDETDPNELAEGLKRSGNEALKLGKHRWADALQYYINALEYNPTNVDLLATIYGNRAQVQLQLGNFGRALDDCIISLQHRPDNVKVLYRASKALLLLGRYKSSMEYCIKALQISGENADVKTLFSTARDKLAVDRRRRREKQQREVDERRIADTCRQRGIHLVEDDEEEDDGIPMQSLIDSRPFLDDDDKLHWPVLILYPEHHTTDQVRDWHEDVRFGEMLAVILAESTDYKLDDIIVTFREKESSEAMHQVRLEATLGYTLHRRMMSIYHHLPTFIITTTTSSYFKAHIEPFLKRS